MKVQYIKICWTQFREKLTVLKSTDKKKPQINVLTLQLKLLKDHQIKLKTETRK